MISPFPWRFFDYFLSSQKHTLSLPFFEVDDQFTFFKPEWHKLFMSFTEVFLDRINVTSCRSINYKVIGVRCCLPWGTPVNTGWASDNTPLYRTACDLQEVINEPLQFCSVDFIEWKFFQTTSVTYSIESLSQIDNTQLVKFPVSACFLMASVKWVTVR